MHNLVISLPALVAASIFFVWVVRYANIVEEFKHHGLPDWLRDLVGILKMTFSLLLLIGIGRGHFAVIGGIGIAVLMAAANGRCARATEKRSPDRRCSSPHRCPSHSISWRREDSRRPMRI